MGPAQLNTGRRALETGRLKAPRPCPSPVSKLIASLEARMLGSESAPLSPGTLQDVDKVLIDGGGDLGENVAGSFSSLSWLLRMDIFERVGYVTESLSTITISCKALHESVLRGVSQRMLQVGGPKEALWRALKGVGPGKDIWRDWVQYGKPQIAALIPDLAFSRSRVAFDLFVGCCTKADRADFMQQLISRGCPFWDCVLCSSCTRTREWCTCLTRSVGITPLALCCIHNHHNTARVLLEAGANMCVGTTLAPAHTHTVLPIHLCAIYGSAKCASVLCVHHPGAASYATPGERLTPLMLALQHEQEHTACVLLSQAHTAVNASSLIGVMASQLVTSSHSDHLVFALHKSGACITPYMKHRISAAQRSMHSRQLQHRSLASINSIPNTSTSASLLTPRGACLLTPRIAGSITSRMMLPPVSLLSSCDDLSTDSDVHSSRSIESDTSSSSDEPLSRSAMKSASSQIVRKGVLIPRLELSTAVTPRALLPPCLKRLDGKQVAVGVYNSALERSARLRSLIEQNGSDSEESSECSLSDRDSSTCSADTLSSMATTPGSEYSSVKIPLLDLPKMNSLNTMAPVAAVMKKKKAPETEDFDALLGELDLSF